MKVLVVGASLSGKTTLLKYLRTVSNVPVYEMDEELTSLNGGEFPKDVKFKHNILTPKIINKILDLFNVIFFTNTNYFDLDDLRKAKNKGFLIIQLELDIDELRARNENRVKEEGYDDVSEWLEGMVQYQQRIKDAGLIDKIIQATEPVEKIAKEILQ